MTSGKWREVSSQQWSSGICTEKNHFHYISHLQIHKSTASQQYGSSVGSNPLSTKPKQN